MAQDRFSTPLSKIQNIRITVYKVTPSGSRHIYASAEFSSSDTRGIDNYIRHYRYREGFDVVMPSLRYNNNYI